MSLTSAQVSAWLKGSSLRAVYVAGPAGSIKLRERLGLRGHPQAVALLHHFFTELGRRLRDRADEGPLVFAEPYALCLVAMLLEESAAPDPADEILDTLLPPCEPLFRAVDLRFQVHESVLALADVVKGLGRPVCYGPFDADTPRHKSACMVWEAQAAFLPPAFKGLVEPRRAARAAHARQLNDEYRQLLGLDPAPSEDTGTESRPEPRAEAGEPSPAKQKRAAGRARKSDVKGEPKTPKAEAKRADSKKLSSFFSVVKRHAAEAASSEYFQPFYLKDQCTMAPISHFADACMMQEDTDAGPGGFWPRFRRGCRQSPAAFAGKPLASCLGWHKGSTYFVAKLVQFHENHHPAYFGSLRSARGAHVSGRRPFAMDPALDYEYDSDDDWCEEEDDAVSILSEDEDEEEEEPETSEPDEEDNVRPPARACADGCRSSWCPRTTRRTRAWPTCRRSSGRATRRVASAGTCTCSRQHTAPRPSWRAACARAAWAAWPGRWTRSAGRWWPSRRRCPRRRGSPLPRRRCRTWRSSPATRRWGWPGCTTSLPCSTAASPRSSLSCGSTRLPRRPRPRTRAGWSGPSGPSTRSSWRRRPRGRLQTGPSSRCTWAPWPWPSRAARDFPCLKGGLFCARAAAAPAMSKEFEEYRLKSSTAATFSHNVMLLQSQTASFADFTEPVRLIRDQKYESGDDEDDEDGRGRAGKVQAGRGRKKRTRILWLEDEDDIALRESESVPWLLEDFDGQHTFTGRLEGGQHSNYVFFVNQGNEFRVIPISRWYRFQPKPNFTPMTIEEAEERMAGKRGPMGTHSNNGPHRMEVDEDGDVRMGKTGRLRDLLRPGAAAKGARPGSRESLDEDREPLDFEDIFDDDDEGVAGEEDPAGDAEPKRKKASALNPHGKQVRKLIKHLDADNFHDEEEDEEDEDPYADDEDLPEEHMPALGAPVGAAAAGKLLQPAPQKPAVGVISGTAAKASGAATPTMRTGSPALSSTSSRRAHAAPAGAAAAATITEADILGIMRGQPPMRTKDLIARLKTKLRADPANKTILRELMKGLVMMRPGAASEDEKLLELRPEYR